LGRIPRLTPDYIAAKERLGIGAGSPAARALARVVLELVAAEQLPLLDDVQAPLPRIVVGSTGLRVVTAYARRVKNRRLWLWYLPRGGEVVELVLVTSAPPRVLE
jgi:hypothetical protein